MEDGMNMQGRVATKSKVVARVHIVKPKKEKTRGYVKMTGDVVLDVVYSS